MRVRGGEAAILGLACLAGLAACEDAAQHSHPGLVTGEQLYGAHCAGCHRDTGDGSFLKGVPPVRYTAMSYRQMVAYIQGHRRSDGSRMPEFVDMPRAEAEKIAIYVRRQLKLR